MKKILVIGSCNMDYVVSAHHIPAAGETILASEAFVNPGGKGANQAFAAARLAGNNKGVVAMIGAVGDDPNGEALKKNLADAGVDVSRVVTRSGVTSGMALITVSDQGENTIAVAAGANATITETDIDGANQLFDDAAIIVMQMEIPLATIVYAAKKAKAAGKTVILDPAPAPKIFPAELYRYIDFIKPNETELAALASSLGVHGGIEACAAALRNAGVPCVLVSMGKDGVFINDEKTGVNKIAAPNVHVVDTTAAGDCFTAALAVRLAHGDDTLKAAEFANKAAALSVTKKGAQSSIPSLEEVLAASLVP
jgi:ribokinase